MTRDFLIIPPEKIDVKHVNKIFDSVMKSKTIKISKNNYIIIGIEDKIIFDVEDHWIKGRILNNSSAREIRIVESVIQSMGESRVYMHFYDENNFIENNLIMTV